MAETLADTNMFYGFTQTPFHKETKVRNLFQSEDTEEMRGRLEFLKETKGIGLFTGNPGSGKTTVLRDFAQSLNSSLYKVIYLQLSTISPTEFLRQISVGLGLEPLYKKCDVFNQVQEEITYLAVDRRCTPVLILDEAQHLSQAILRDLVMLLNFDMDSKNHCIVIMSGHSSLNGILKKAVNEPLRQRLAVNYTTCGLSLKETHKYIEYMLKECGVKTPIFTEAAINTAYESSQGMVRNLNSILSISLMQGASRQERMIDQNTIYEAAQEIKLA